MSNHLTKCILQAGASFFVPLCLISDSILGRIGLAGAGIILALLYVGKCIEVKGERKP